MVKVLLKGLRWKRVTTSVEQGGVRSTTNKRTYKKEKKRGKKKKGVRSLK